MADGHRHVLVAEAARHWRSVAIAPPAGAASRILHPGPTALWVPRMPVSLVRWNTRTLYPTQSLTPVPNGGAVNPAALIGRRWRI